MLITDALERRQARLPDYRAEAAVLHAIARAQSFAPSNVLDELLRAVLVLCQAHSAGISIAGIEGDPGVYRWTNVVGAFAHFVGGFTPVDFSPCGLTIARGSPQLFRRPDRYFPYFQGVMPTIEEGLVVPFEVGDGLIGTMWIVSHDPAVVFDREHVRILVSLGPLAGRAVLAADHQRRAHAQSRAWTQQVEEVLTAKTHTVAKTDADAEIEQLRTLIAQGSQLADTWMGADALLRTTDHVRRLAVDAQRQAEDLIEIGQALAGELDAKRLGGLIARLSSQALDAQLGAFLTLGNESDGVGEPHLTAIVAEVGVDGLHHAVHPEIHALPATSTVIIADAHAEAEADPLLVALRQAHVGAAYRSSIVVPVHARSGALLGNVVVASTAPHAFTLRHERLLTNLVGIAAQSLDSAHRFRDERAIRRQIEEREQLGRLNGEISRALIAPLPLTEVLRRCCSAILASLDAAFVRIWTYEQEEQELVLRTSVGLYTHLDGAHARIPIGAFKIGRIAHHRQPHVTNAVATDPEIGDHAWAEREGMVSFAGYPLVVGDELLGVIGLFARHALSPAVIELLAAASVGIAASIDRHRQAERLAATLAQLRQSNSDLDRFTAIASHDLLEPTRTVTSFLGLLLRRNGEQLDERGRVFVGHAMAASERMSTLIHSLLAYARLTGSSAQQVSVPLAEPVGDAVDNLTTRIAEVAGTITIGSLPVVRGDRGLLAQLFQNLLANALKFRRLGIAPVVEITARTTAGECQVLITDNGIGIPEEHRQRIFEMFQRLHAEAEYAGSGIGLATCRRLVERMQGRIWVEPHPGPGTTFAIALQAAGSL